MKKLSILLSFMLAGMLVFGQTYFMSDESATTCSGDFYDSGGPYSNYSSNESYTKTFNSVTPGSQYLQFNFTSFYLKTPGDVLRIYDGPDNTYPLLDSYQHKNSPGLVTATNEFGALTFEFVSFTHNKTEPGWHASISCVTGAIANEDCGTALPINEVTNLPFTTVNATASGTNPGCGGNQDPVDLWYAYTATASGEAIFELCSSDFNTRLALWADCNGGTPLDCDVTSGNNLCSSFAYPVTAGTTYYVQVGGKNQFTGVGDLTIYVIFDGIWTGTNSTDWNDPGNWSANFVPQEFINVTIPSTPTGGNYPETNTGTGASCLNLNIEAGAHLYVPAGNSLTVGGTLSNNSGTAGLVIQADATGMGSLIHSTPNVAATVEQYLTSEVWHMVSAPISNAQTGVYFDIYLYSFNEPTNTWTNLVLPITDPLNVTQGYRVWADDGYTGPTAVSFSGNLNNGDYPISSLSFTPGSPSEGWNLIGNPYASALQWNGNWIRSNLGDWACVDIDETSACYNAVTGELYSSDPNVTPGMIDGIIPSTQGFWVRALNDAGSLTIPQSERLHSDQPFYKQTPAAEIKESLSLQIEGNNGNDELLVQFYPDATAGFDGTFDLDKFLKEDNEPQFFTYAQDKEYAVNVLPEIYNGLIVPVGFEADETGLFSISVSEFRGFEQDINIYLEDLSDKSFTQLTPDTKYSFAGNPDDDAHRFNLHFKSGDTGMDSAIEDDIRIYSHDNIVYIQQPDGFNGPIHIYNMMGQEVLSATGTGQGLMSLKVENRTGFYVVKVNHSGNLVTEKVFIK